MPLIWLKLSFCFFAFFLPVIWVTTAFFFFFFLLSPQYMLNIPVSIWLAYIKFWNFYIEDCGSLKSKNIHISFYRQASTLFKRTLGLSMQPSHHKYEAASKFIDSGLSESVTHKVICNSWLQFSCFFWLLFFLRRMRWFLLEYNVLSYKPKILYQIHFTNIM